MIVMNGVKVTQKKLDHLIDTYGMKVDIDGDGRLSRKELGFIFDAMDKKKKTVDVLKLGTLIHNYKNRTEESVCGAFLFRETYLDNKLSEKSIICRNPETNQVEYVETNRFNSEGIPTESIIRSRQKGTEITTYDENGQIKNVIKTDTAIFDVST